MALLSIVKNSIMGPVSMGLMGLAEPITFQHEVLEPINILNLQLKVLQKEPIEAITDANDMI